MSKLSKKKAQSIANAIVGALRDSVRLSARRPYIDFTCHWFAAQGWTPWQVVKDLDVVMLVAQTIVNDDKIFGERQLPLDADAKWSAGWMMVRDAAYDLLKPEKKPSTSVSLKPVPTVQLKHWLDAARRGGGEHHPAGWRRAYTIANLTAELSLRPDRHDIPDKKQRKVLRRAAAQRQGART